MTGTIWGLLDLFKGASDGINALLQKGKKIVYVTNNAMRTNDQYMQQFKKLQINAKIVSIYQHR